jgi:eukaryotic-like serine/threonine-protein kinase
MARRTLSAGSRIGSDLTVLGVVDDGGVDAVYMVWCHSAWHHMACKLFAKPRKAQAEGNLLRALDHPGVVRWLGQGPPGYVLMEYLDGPTLKQVVEDAQHKKPGAAPLSLGNALRIAIYIGSALMHLHGRGYLHMDVKPHNVIIHRNRPVLFDLGIARPVAKAQLSAAIGTDAYMAPEQCQRGLVSTATDVFGLAVLSYQILTGHLPFARGTQRNEFPQTRSDPTPLRTHLPRAPQSLERLLLACMQRDPLLRPPLPDLLLGLHAHIRRGPQMWPSNFDPSQAPQGQKTSTP